MAFVGHLFGGDLTPLNFTRPTVDAENHKLMIGVRGVGPFIETGVGLGKVCGISHAFGVDCGGDKDLVTANNRRGASEAGDGDLPADICFFIPADRRIAFRGNAGCQRPAPLMPVVERGQRSVAANCETAEEAEMADREKKLCHRWYLTVRKTSLPAKFRAAIGQARQSRTG